MLSNTISLNNSYIHQYDIGRLFIEGGDFSLAVLM